MMFLLWLVIISQWGVMWILHLRIDNCVEHINCLRNIMKLNKEK